MQRMTRKKFIKLLMGKFRFSRDKARQFADKIVLWHEIDDTNNATFKKLGIESRENPSSYYGYYGWINITELSKQLAAQEGESKWNSITKF